MTDYYDDRFELYKLALKKVREAGYKPTKDRIWDQYVTLVINFHFQPPRHFLEKHDFNKYWQMLEVD